MPRILLPLCALSASIAMLAGCGSSSSSASTTASTTASSTSVAPSSSTDSSSSSSSAASSAAPSGGTSSCSKYKGGEGGVIRTFCDGSATATITLAGHENTLKGGTCAQSGGYFTVNIGVVAGPDFTGTKPDYLGLLLPPAGGAVSSQTFAGAAGGTRFLVTGGTGSVSPDFKTVSLTGNNALAGGSAVAVTVHC